MLASLGPSGDDELDAAVTEETAKEAGSERGWLEGLFSREQLDAKLGLWLPARRFGPIVRVA